MSIKTHYALKQASETDNGKMNSRTSRSSACKLYFACNEGAGTTLTDYGPEGVVLDNADANTTVAYSTANMMDIIHADAVPNSGDISNLSPGSDSFMVFMHGIPNTLALMFQFCLGSTSANQPRFEIAEGNETCVVSSGTDSSASLKLGTSTVTLTEDVFWAFFCDRTTQTGYLFESLNGAAVALKDSGSVSNVGSITFANKLSMNTVAAQSVYGFGYYVFENDVPTYADMLEKLEAIRVNTKSADKSLPVDWISYT